MSHSPGPWRCVGNADIEAADTALVATTYDDNPKDQSNARLISAAPELLQRLKDLLDYAEAFCDAGEHLYQFSAARALIARLEGK